MIKESIYAIFNYEESDKDLIDELMLYIDNNVDNIHKFFNVKDIKKANIIITPTKEIFDQMFMEEYPWSKETGVDKSSRGFCKRDGTIVYLSIKDYDKTTHAYDIKDFDKVKEGFKKTLVHEYVHFINRSFNIENKCYPTAKYLVEGIAIYLSKQKENEDLSFTYSIDDILETNSNKVSYNAYYLVTKYLIENCDKKYIISLFKDKEKAIKLLKEELYDKVKRYYTKEY